MNYMKICVIGSYACGKTSFVSQLLDGSFSEKYQTTLGVKIHKKEIASTKLALWDLPGVDFLSSINLLYIKDAAGIVLAVDGMREGSMSTAIDLYSTIRNEYPNMPIVTILNKCDVSDQWTIKQTELERAKAQGLDLFHTSAKTGENILAAVEHLLKAV